MSDESRSITNPLSDRGKKEMIFNIIDNSQCDDEITLQKSAFWDESQNRKLFKCPYDSCKRIFKEKGNLRTHLRVHTGERPFVCDFEGCDKSFITMGNLKSHMCNHTGEKPFQCPFCGKKYARLCRLKIHQRTHTGNKPFRCPYKGCNKTFNEKGNLKTHLRIHTGEKPYLCNYEGCNQAFKAHGHLKDHLKRHYNIRPYKCDICQANFSRSSTLKIHTHTHTGVKPYSCPVLGCDKKFSERGNMRTHLKTHKLTVDEEIKSRMAVEDNMSKDSTNSKNTSHNVNYFGHFLNSFRNSEINNLKFFFEDLQSKAKNLNLGNLIYLRSVQNQFESLKILFEVYNSNYVNQYNSQIQSYLSTPLNGMHLMNYFNGNSIMQNNSYQFPYITDYDQQISELFTLINRNLCNIKYEK